MLMYFQLNSPIETLVAASSEMAEYSFPAPHSQQHLQLVWRTPQTQCSKVLLCSLKVIFHCYFRLCFVLVKLFCFRLEIQTGNFCLSNDSVTKVKHSVTMFPHLPSNTGVVPVHSTMWYFLFFIASNLVPLRSCAASVQGNQTLCPGDDRPLFYSSANRTQR